MNRSLVKRTWLRIKIIGVIISLGFLLTCSAQAKISFIPLPLIDTDPNAGETFGFLPVFLFLDQEDQLTSMIAPDLTYNETTGFSGTFRYFGYPEEDQQYYFILSQSTKKRHDYELYWEDSSFFNEKYMLEIELFSSIDPTARFYGLGNKSHENNETNYSHKEVSLKFTGGVKLLPYTHLALTESYRRVSVKEGEEDDLPFSHDLFPGISGLTRSRIWAHSLSLTYDSRDSGVLPTEGTYARILWEFSFKDLVSSSSFVRTTLEFKKLFPNSDKRFILVLRGRGEFLLRRDNSLPFYEESLLGGWDTLRGFGDQRFIDHHLLLFNAEERIRVFTRRIFGVEAEFEVAPFIEAGRVFRHLSDIDGGRYHVVSGLGFRALVRPHIVGYVDVGIGDEGATVFMGIGYPF
jgi:outer membrane protein assembly factor BamA